MTRKNSRSNALILVASALWAAILLCSASGQTLAKSNHDKRFETACKHLKCKRYKTAHKHLHDLADSGHARAQTVLGMLYENGVGVEKDAEKAYEYYKKAADQELPEAQSQLGHFLLKTGITVRKDSDEAVTWLRKAAQHGVVEAQSTLGQVLVEAKNMPASHSEGVWWLKEAARRGSDQAKEALSKLPGADKVEAGAQQVQAHFQGAGSQYQTGMENIERSWKGYADIVNTVNQAAAYHP
ncbi:MAG: sel1 repeat family protein [Cyanobacteria bacterium HKST-UBA02]|nr:sel1 repeat family protein [Cyanobacteria bacterium HKST-UBA02]